MSHSLAIHIDSTPAIAPFFAFEVEVVARIIIQLQPVAIVVIAIAIK